MLGVGMTPPYVLGTANPESSVIINRMFGAFCGGTIRGAHHAFDFCAVSRMTPPNSGSGAGNCLPSIVVVAFGEPGVPVDAVLVGADELVGRIRGSCEKFRRAGG